MIYFTTDTHYGHPNIVYGVSEWEDKETSCRKYDTIEEMNNDIVNAINSVVGPDDILYHLGDWSLGGIDNIWKFRKRLHVKTIHLVLGNHDEQIEENKSINIPYYDKDLYEYLTGNTLSQYDFTGTDYFTVPCRSLFTSVEWYMKLKIKGQKAPLTMFHFACRVWLKSHAGGIFLHGHSHGNLQPYTDGVYEYKTLDVYRENFLPWSLDDIIKEMKYKVSVKGIDHHNKLDR